ncbi:hypothetical protein BMT54_02125 [Pasteurellaceae bacterium 15-036681]|nr:hypothetical protein BMT54_02125 [Pasteurellaceae bacterium 15-036681]
MLFKKINVQPAVSLIEILISLSLASFILLIASSLYSQYYYTQSKQRELLNLQTHTHQLLDYFQQHIQHMNYQGNYRENSNFDLFSSKDKNYLLEGKQCLMFFYDLNGDGCIGNRNKTQACQVQGLNKTNNIAKELFGFKFENQAIYIYEDNQIQTCYGQECEIFAKGCNIGKWSKMADMGDYIVTQLNFSWLKEDKLLKIELSLKSTKLPKVEYSATAYSYLFNSGED